MELHLFQSAWDLIDINPFAMKVDIFMQLAKLEYTAIYDYNSENAPRAELPYLVDSSHTLGDSSQIIVYLLAEYPCGMDENLDARQAAQALCVQRMLEVHLYPIILYSRMVDPAGLQIFKQDIFSKVDNYNETAVDQLAAGIQKKLVQQGIGRYSSDEIYQFGIDDLEAVSSLLNAGEYFLGPQVSSIDATIYAFLENIRAVPIDNPMNRWLSESELLNNYCDMLRSRTVSV